MTDETPVDVAAAKVVIRREMRTLRRSLPDRAARSERIWAVVRQLAVVEGARSVLAFASIVGEPDTGPFISWCRDVGKQVWLPEDDPPPPPGAIDVVIVPGLAFTAAGDRLGQGGGWYDRFLDAVRNDCVSIGVGFGPQLLADLPTERHDVRLDVVVTDDRVTGGSPSPSTSVG